MAGGKGVKKKQTVKTAKKASPAAGKSKKAVKAPRKMPTAAGQRKKTVKTGKNASKGGTGKRMAKTPGKNTTAVGRKKPTMKMPGATAACKASKTPKPKTATSIGKKIKDVKPRAATNYGVGPTSKLIKKKTSKVQASGANPGTSQNAGQTSTKKRAPKRKLDQPKQATPSIKKIRTNIPWPADYLINSYEDHLSPLLTMKSRKTATPSIKKMPINLPKQEMSRPEDKRPIHINVVQPVQTNPPPFNNTVPVQQHYHYHQKREDFQIQARTKHRDMSVPDCNAREHFVDKHREALIHRVPLVDPILDSLVAENVLKGEPYDKIRSKPTTQEKMRELYKYITGIGDAAKDKFYNALKKHNDLLIQGLENIEGT